MRSRGCFGVVLNRKDRFVFNAQARKRSIKQREVRCFDVVRQAVFINNKAVVLGCDFDNTGGGVLDRVVRTTMANIHFLRLGAKGQRHHLMTKTDAKDRLSAVHQFLNGRNGICTGCRRVTGAV